MAQTRTRKVCGMRLHGDSVTVGRSLRAYLLPTGHLRVCQTFHVPLNCVSGFWKNLDATPDIPTRLLKAALQVSEAAERWLAKGIRADPGGINVMVGVSALPVVPSHHGTIVVAHYLVLCDRLLRQAFQDGSIVACGFASMVAECLTHMSSYTIGVCMLQHIGVAMAAKPAQLWGMHVLFTIWFRLATTTTHSSGDLCCVGGTLTVPLVCRPKLVGVYISFLYVVEISQRLGSSQKPGTRPCTCWVHASEVYFQPVFRVAVQD